jgi:WD40 repeat protein
MRFLSGTELLATVAVDGVAKLWDCSSGCMWTSTEVMRLENGRIDDCAVLELVQLQTGSALLVAGSRTGFIYAWLLDLKAYASRDFWKFKPLDVRRTNMPVISESVQEISVDKGSSAMLVQYKDDPCFYRVTWMDGPQSTVECFGHFEDHISCLTAMATDFAANADEMPSITTHITSVNGTSTPSNHAEGTITHVQATSQYFSNLSYVIAGDDQGRTFIWDWNGRGQQGDKVIKPIMQLQGFDTKVTSIKITQTLFMIGS